FIVVLLAGNAFGPSFGFVLGAVGTFASGLFDGGLGPWLPLQMIAIGWVGAGAGLMRRSARWGLRFAGRAAAGFVAAFAFGIVINLWSWPYLAGSARVGWSSSASLAANVKHYAAFYALTSAGWDIFGAVGNALLVVLIGRPVLGALDRAAKRLDVHVDISQSDLPARPLERDNGRYLGAGRATAAFDLSVEDSPDSTGQDAGESPRRGDPWTAPQRQTASDSWAGGKGETVR
ncbi:MAG: energy-coupling factor transport system substrate-specific component, partial [Actinomycetota bacterium]|nr:energy-coupling factor transport system substrate-specific component [Actinomycetota bacterium]